MSHFLSQSLQFRVQNRATVSAIQSAKPFMYRNDVQIQLMLWPVLNPCGEEHELGEGMPLQSSFKKFLMSYSGLPRVFCTGHTKAEMFKC